MAHSLSHYVIVFLVLVCEVIAVQSTNFHAVDYSNDIVMEEEELLGLFEVMESLLDDEEWSQMHPLPCTDTPWPGIQCEIGDEEPPIYHVSRIHVAPDIINPPCKNSATLPVSLHKLPYLKTLSIFNCFVASKMVLSPSLFDHLSSLEHLALESNPSLCGKIPSGLSQIGTLKVLRLSQNGLQGEIPSGFGELVNLEELDLSYNNLIGEIPEQLGGLKNFRILDLSFNRLAGQIPASFGQLQVLQKMDLGSNKLIGTIPPELGRLKRLVLLDLSHNSITGPLPLSLSGFDNLQYLLIDHNPINSGIPLFLGSLKRLTSLSLSGCGLTGTIPNSISLLKNLTALYLDNNRLNGTVPSSLGKLQNLDSLNVSHNQLTGELELPEEFLHRLGNRLDVRGNSGLCTMNETKNNMPINLETPTCLVTMSSNKTCHKENSDVSLSRCSCLDIKSIFVLIHLLFLFLI